jgi:hypothetical protein
MPSHIKIYKKTYVFSEQKKIFFIQLKITDYQKEIKNNCIIYIIKYIVYNILIW